MFNKLEKYRRFMPMFWPAFIEQILAVIIGLVSTAMVAGVGTSAVAGVGMISTLNFMVMSAFISIATGATVIVAHCIGRRDRQEALETAAQSLTLTVYISILAGGMLIIFDKALLNALFGAAESEVLESARTYLFYSSISMPLLAFCSTINGVLRATGNMRTPMFASTASIVSNIVVAAIAIFGFDMGVAGAGLGIVAFRLAPAILLGLYIKQGNGLFAGFKPTLKIRAKTIKPVLEVAVPAGVDSMIFNGCKVIVQVFMTNMGTDTMAANAITGQLLGLINLPGGALSVLTTSVVGQLYGSGDEKGARRDTWRLFAMSTAFSFAAGLLVLLFLHPLLSLFNPNNTVYTMSRNISVMFVIMLPMFWPASFQVPSALRSMGKARFTMVVSIISMIVLRVFGAWLLGVYFNLGLYGIMAAMFLDWVGRSICFLWSLGIRKPVNENAAY